MKRIQSTQYFKLAVLVFCLAIPYSVISQTPAEFKLADEARELVKNGQRLDALPILEKIIKSFPKDAELWADYGVALMVQATTINDVEKRAAGQKRAVEALKHAQTLGTTNPTALDFLNEFEKGDGSDNFADENPEVEKALRQGEYYFGRGEFELAFDHYKKAHDLAPKNYEAILFMGDCFYARKMYAESIPYFRQAVDLNPGRAMAHLYWADALLYMGDHTKALDKFIDVLIRDPFSNTSWDSLRRWSGIAKVEYVPLKIAPPGSDITGPINIDPLKLQKSDGTDSWTAYTEALQAWTEKNARAKGRFSLADEERAWKKVAERYKKSKADGSVKAPDSSLENLARLDSDSLLKPYLYFMRPRNSFDDDYDEVMKNDGILVRRFIKKYFFNLPEETDSGY